MKIKDMISQERPMEKLSLLGKEALTNRELLALLIKSGSRQKSALQLADEILNRYAEGLSSLTDITIEELSEISGIGVAKASTILAAIELGQRISTNRNISKGQVVDVEDVVSMFMDKLRFAKKEHFEALLLDNKGSLLAKEPISVGDLSSSLVHPRETFKAAIKKSAAGIILIHNHPSGDATPSEKDIKVTRRLIKAGELLGISVLDHIIIGDGTYISMNAKGII